MNLNFYEDTKLGARKNNQDFFVHVIAPDWASFIVADGLGGHAKGEVASQVFCECAMEQVQLSITQLKDDPAQAMPLLIQSTHDAMKKKIIEAHGFIDTHTTFAMVWFNEKHFITAHVGDSRIYRLDKTGVLWRTPDHTLVQKLFEEGKISEADFENHPLQNRLLKTVNLYDPPQPDFFSQSPLSREETLLLCTDGFWTHLLPDDFIQMATKTDLKGTVDTLIEMIIVSHPRNADNVTVQVVRL